MFIEMFFEVADFFAKFVLSGLALFFILWVAYVILMTFDQVLFKKFPKNTVMGWVVRIIGYCTLYPPAWLLDVIFNQLWCAYYFKVAHRHLTLTNRLIEILLTMDENSYQFRHALWICKYMLEPWQMGHCGLIYGIITAKEKDALQND